MKQSVEFDLVALDDSNPDQLAFLPIDPFGVLPHVASRVTGLGGTQPADDAGYVFWTVFIRPVLGPVHFALHFHQLQATHGVLSIRIDALSDFPGLDPMLIKIIEVPLSDLAEKDGVIEIELISRPRFQYRLSGRIDGDTDARASILGVSLYPRERADPMMEPDAGVRAAPATGIVAPRLRERPEMVAIDRPTLTRPVSQPLTSAQFDEPTYSEWMSTLSQDAEPTELHWGEAFVLQALHHYGVPIDRARVLGFGDGNALPAYFAGRGCSVLVAAVRPDAVPGRDPGLALKNLHRSELCSASRFFEAVDFGVVDIHALPPGVADFDFLWSFGVADTASGRAGFARFIQESLRCLRPGGMALHLFHYSGLVGSQPPPQALAGFGRAEIERIALSLIAQGQEVAQLKFDIGAPDRVSDAGIPFGLIARRLR